MRERVEEIILRPDDEVLAGTTLVSIQVLDSRGKVVVSRPFMVPRTLEDCHSLEIHWVIRGKK